MPRKKKKEVEYEDDDDEEQEEDEDEEAEEEKPKAKDIRKAELKLFLAQLDKRFLKIEQAIKVNQEYIKNLYERQNQLQENLNLALQKK